MTTNSFPKFLRQLKKYLNDKIHKRSSKNSKSSTLNLAHDKECKHENSLLMWTQLAMGIWQQAIQELEFVCWNNYIPGKIKIHIIYSKIL